MLAYKMDYDNCSPSAALSFVEIHFENAGCVASYIVV